MNADQKEFLALFKAMPPWEQTHWHFPLKRLYTWERIKEGAVRKSSVLSLFERIPENKVSEEIYRRVKGATSQLLRFPSYEEDLPRWESQFRLNQPLFSYDGTSVPFLEARNCLWEKLSPIAATLELLYDFDLSRLCPIEPYLPLMGDLFLFFLMEEAMHCVVFLREYPLGGEPPKYTARNFERFMGCRVDARQVGDEGDPDAYVELLMSVAFRLRGAKGKPFYLIREIESTPLRTWSRMSELIHGKKTAYGYPVTSRLDVVRFSEELYEDPIELFSEMEDRNFDVPLEVKYDFLAWAMENPRRRSRR